MAKATRNPHSIPATVAAWGAAFLLLCWCGTAKGESSRPPEEPPVLPARVSTPSEPVLLGKLEALDKRLSWIVMQGAAGAGLPPGDPTVPAGTPTRPQLNASASIADLFPTARQIQYVVVTVADPRVPRHRRLYDNAITAISQGMLTNGFVLDRYEFPWQNDLKQPGVGFQSLLESVSNDERFGLMVFRRDNWRYERVSAYKSLIDVRAVYVVPETATYGVQSAALSKALQTIDGQIRITLSGYPPAADGLPPSPPKISVFGPTFSGSLDSILRINAAGKIALISASTTARSNSNVEKLPGEPLSFDSWAITDADKLRALGTLKTSLGVPKTETDRKSSIAFLYETSVFGFDVCHGSSSDRPAVCDAAREFSFPANIADIRFGVRKRAAESAQARTSSIVPTNELPHLALEDGAENGSEFPESYQSPLTAVANQLDLDVSIAAMRRSAPRVAVVIATDVRDRLFLFEQLRSQLENTMLIDLETDRLLAHPDSINFTRGAMTLASSEITTSAGAWSTDNQALLAYLLCKWSIIPAADGTPGRTCTLGPPPPDASVTAAIVTADSPRYVHLHVVTRNGLSSAAQLEGACGNRARCSGSYPLLAPFFTLFICFAICCWWYFKPASKVKQRRFRCVDMRALVLVPLLLPMWFVQPTGRAMLAVIIVVIAGIIATLYRLYAQNSAYMSRVIEGDKSAKMKLSWRVLPLCAAVLLFLMLGLELWNLALIGAASKLPEEGAAIVDIRQQVDVMRAALTGNATGGLAYGLALTAVGGALLFAFAASRAYTTATHRNHYVRGNSVARLKVTETVETGETGEMGVTKLLRQSLTYCDEKAEQIGIGERGCAWLLAAVVGAVALGFFAWPVIKSQARLTLFGERASITIYIGLLAVTVIGVIMFAAAMWIVNQVDDVCRNLEATFRESCTGTGKTDFAWNLAGGRLPRFATTPILATTNAVSDALEKHIQDPATWQLRLRELHAQTNAETSADVAQGDAAAPVVVVEGDAKKIAATTEDDAKKAAALDESKAKKAAVVINDRWTAAYGLFASYMMIYRWSMLGVLVATFAAAAIVYLFPVSDSDGLLLINLALLLAVGLHSAFITVRFESNAILSGVLCNRPAKASWSTGLFGFIAFPFVALAIAVAIAQIPGVLNWGDGLFDLLVKLTRPSVLK